MCIHCPPVARLMSAPGAGERLAPRGPKPPHLARAADEPT